jgi:predicted GH43/DUF377 family glycosyl hydrolase
MTSHSFLNRQALYLRPDPARVLIRPFNPTADNRDLDPLGRTRAKRMLERIHGLDPAIATALMADVLENFAGRHRNLRAVFEARADEVEPGLLNTPAGALLRQLIGAFFLHEYAFESAALFNPSIVRHPDQTGAPEGGMRFVLSLRAVGEGHVSSLTFRVGSIAADGAVQVDPTARLATLPRVVSRREGPLGQTLDLRFAAEEDISERVIFPLTREQANGIEDARFVLFTDDDGSQTYYATYTAYDGRAIRSELIETKDFLNFRMTPLAGEAARNKGMSLFPRRIGGRYAMISRQDNENLYLIMSDDLYTWNGGVMLLQPEFAWEFVQIGNCGSPIELDEGWLMLTHGVGAVRRYAIGAALLDKKDPSRVLARAREPLVHPEPSEREGYVPNVVYTCGAIRHRGLIVLPYAVCDSFSNFATIRIDALLAAMDG